MGPPADLRTPAGDVAATLREIVEDAETARIEAAQAKAEAAQAKAEARPPAR